MKKLFVMVLILFLVFSPIRVSGEKLDLAPKAISAILIEASTGDVIYEKNANEKRSPASMTKMMSMLLFIEDIEKDGMKWDEIITASSNAASMGGSQIFLEANEQMTVTDMLKGVAIGSANDATVALAERVAGTEENFVIMMNKRGQELGLKNTVFKNSTGLDAEGHYSTARDMATIAIELVKHQKILDFTGTYEDYIRSATENKFWLVNTNKLVRFYEGIDGLKTGYTDNSLYCLTATAKKNNMRLIASVLGEPSSSERNEEVKAMIEYGFNQYKVTTVFTSNKVLGKVPVIKGKSRFVTISLKENLTLLQKKTEENKKVNYEIELDNVEAPIKKGDVIGTLYLMEKGNLLKSADLVANEAVLKTNLWFYYIDNLRDVFGGSITF